MRDLYQVVTDRIVAALEGGTPPWIKPWSTSDLRPRNAVSRRMYRGINTILLTLEAESKGYSNSRWLTFYQAKELNAHVKGGEHGAPVVFYKLTEVIRTDKETGEIKTNKAPLLRSFTVFNVDQIEGLPEHMLEPVKAPRWSPHAEANRLLIASGIKAAHVGGAAYYHIKRDVIHLPVYASFPDMASYTTTMLHELTHATGHPSRCNRDLSGHFGNEAYALEELIAEMGSAFLCAHCGIDGKLQHASYVSSWLRVLKNDKRAIFTASAKAQAGADWVLQAGDAQALAA